MAEDLERYTRQYGYVKEICMLFDEDPDNTDAVRAKLEEVESRACIQMGVKVACNIELGCCQAWPPYVPSLRICALAVNGRGSHPPAQQCGVHMGGSSTIWWMSVKYCPVDHLLRCVEIQRRLGGNMWG